MPGTLPEQSQKKLILPNLTTGLRYCTKEADKHKKKLKEKSNTPRKADTGSTKLPLPIATQLYRKRKVKTNSRKPVLRTRQNLLQSK
jgi:hypothetical protein